VRLGSVETERPQFQQDAQVDLGMAVRRPSKKPVGAGSRRYDPAALGAWCRGRSTHRGLPGLFTSRASRGSTRCYGGPDINPAVDSCGSILRTLHEWLRRRVVDPAPAADPAAGYKHGLSGA
jgi:hypothetical protein